MRANRKSKLWVFLLGTLLIVTLGAASLMFGGAEKSAFAASEIAPVATPAAGYALENSGANIAAKILPGGATIGTYATANEAYGAIMGRAGTSATIRLGDGTNPLLISSHTQFYITDTKGASRYGIAVTEGQNATFVGSGKIQTDGIVFPSYTDTSDKPTNAVFLTFIHSEGASNVRLINATIESDYQYDADHHNINGIYLIQTGTSSSLYVNGGTYAIRAKTGTSLPTKLSTVFNAATNAKEVTVANASLITPGNMQLDAADAFVMQNCTIESLSASPLYIKSKTISIKDVKLTTDGRIYDTSSSSAAFASVIQAMASESIAVDGLNVSLTAVTKGVIGLWLNAPQTSVNRAAIEIGKGVALLFNGFDAKLTVTDSTFVSENNGTDYKMTLTAIKQEQQGNMPKVYDRYSAEFYGTVCFAGSGSATFGGKNTVNNTSTASTAFAVATARSTFNGRIVQPSKIAEMLSYSWSEASQKYIEKQSNGQVTGKEYTAEEMKSLAVYQNPSASFPVTKSIGKTEFYLNDNVNFTSDANGADIYVQQLDEFEIHAGASYVSNADNQRVSLFFENVENGNVAVYGTTETKLFRLKSQTHALSADVKNNNLVMKTGDNVYIFSAVAGDDRVVVIEGGYIDLGWTEVTKVTVGDVAATVVPDYVDHTFTARTDTAVGAGKKLVTVTYTVKLGDSGSAERISTVKMLIIIPEIGSDGNLTGNIEFGSLSDGDQLQYKDNDGAWKEVDPDGAIPNDILLNDEGNADFKFVDGETGEEFVY